VPPPKLRPIRLSRRSEPFDSDQFIYELKIDGFRFDLLFLEGEDLRTLSLLERTAVLKKLLRRKRSRILYLDHVENDGRLLFDQIVKMDLEGIVCKRKDSPYKVTEKPSRHWIKVKNSRYSQLEGREELFERV